MVIEQIQMQCLVFMNLEVLLQTIYLLYKDLTILDPVWAQILDILLCT